MCANELKLCIYLQVERLMYMEPRKKPRELKNMIRFSVNSLLQHKSSCCSLINFTVWMKKVTWLPRDFSTYFDPNWGVSHKDAISKSVPLHYYSRNSVNKLKHRMDIVVLFEGNSNSRNIPDFFNTTLLHNTIIIHINTVTSFCDIMILYHELTNESFQQQTFLESLWFDTDGSFFALLIPGKKVIFF